MLKVFLKAYNTEFDKIIINFANQNCRLLEIEDKVNLTLLKINKHKWTEYKQKWYALGA